MPRHIRDFYVTSARPTSSEYANHYAALLKWALQVHVEKDHSIVGDVDFILSLYGSILSELS